MKSNNPKLFTNIQAIAIDLDGVVYKGDDVICGAADAIRNLRPLVKWIYFITNNSGKRRETIQQKLFSMNIPSEKNEIITSAYATAMLLKSLSKPGNEFSMKVFVIGSDELKSEIKELGIAVEEDKDRSKPNFLVVGFDKEFSYRKICDALDVLSSGAKFVACNRDRTFPVENGVKPGCGSMVASIEWAWGRKPDYEVGKPNTFILDMMTSETKVKANQILVVGDMLESDIAMAINFGSPSVLISEPGRKANTELAPNLRIRSLADLPEAYNRII